MSSINVFSLQFPTSNKFTLVNLCFPFAPIISEHVVFCALTAAHKHEEALSHAVQKLVNNRQVTATQSQSGQAHPGTHTQHPTRGRIQQQGGENPIIVKLI